MLKISSDLILITPTASEVCDSSFEEGERGYFCGL